MEELTLNELCVKAVELLKNKSLKCTFAESLTGGLIASSLVGVSGASDVLEGSLVSYSDRVKNQMLNVSNKTLEEDTAVSSSCAVQMAMGARKMFDADIAVSATGYAGPTGGTDEDPAGTFYIGFSDSFTSGSKRFCLADSTRQEVREFAALCAMRILVYRLESL